MTNNEFVEFIFKNKRQDIVKILIYHNIFDKNKQEDLEFILYEKLLKFKNINKYIKNDEPNMFIVFKIIKNIIITDFSNNKKTRYEQIENYEVEDIIEEDDINILKFNWIQEEINKEPNHFKRNIIFLYFNTEHSLRSLAKETKIGISTIAPIIKNFKNKIQNEIKNKKF